MGKVPKKNKPVSALKKMFPGIDGVTLVKNKDGISVSKRVKNIKRKTKNERYSDSESWM